MPLKEAASGGLNSGYTFLTYQETLFKMGFAYKIADRGAVYFITCTVSKWVEAGRTLGGL